MAKSKLIELGVQPDFVMQLNEEGVRDLLKGLLYLREKYGFEDIEAFQEP